MKFFVDTAEVTEIKDLLNAGFLDGVTTNPSLIAKSKRDFKEVVEEICSLTDKPVSAEVSALDANGMIAEGQLLAGIADNVVVKLPLTLEGLKACAHFKAAGIKTNVTLCFSPNQALLAAKAGATYISPFVGRLDDINLDGSELIRDIRIIYDNYDLETQIIAASLRTPNHVTQSALTGADIATIPPDVLRKLADHPLTTNGIKQFLKDWEATGQTIL
ncbi:fructose-6-phosphate aldolase [Celeribacter halophilus]|uniref:fructose-6-phosphate aldolase n=1 Tax=Celeribacter halophilus TaxID=576117 RepID=UPI003A9230F6